jgi:hypothetical protein
MNVLLQSATDDKRVACRLPAGRRAFSLMEVMIALVIFFSCVFTILELVSGTLRNARALQQNEPDLGRLAAQDAMNKLTNSVEGEATSDDFGKDYPGYSWTKERYPVASNGLYEVDYTVSHRVGRGEAETHLSVLFFQPNLPVTAEAPRGLQ